MDACAGQRALGGGREACSDLEAAWEGTVGGGPPDLGGQGGQAQTQFR